MQHLLVLAGAVLSLVAIAIIVGLVLKRAPLLFVADKLPGNLYAGPDDVGELITGPDDEETMAREGVDVPDGAGPSGDEPQRD